MLLLLISFLLNFSQPVETGSLQVVIQNVDIASDETVRVGLYNNPSVFPDEDKQYLGKILPASRSTLTFQFDNLAPGNYALASFQDENNDGVLNTNFFGAPTEEYGFSQNPSIWFRAPDFEDCQVKVNPGQETRIVIKL